MFDQVAGDVPLHPEVEGDDVRPRGRGLGMCRRLRSHRCRADRIETAGRAGLPGERLAGMTSRTRSRPTRPGLALALATRLASSRSVVERMPFIAPRLRVRRTRARVSIPSMPMMPCSARDSRRAIPLRGSCSTRLLSSRTTNPGPRAGGFPVLGVDAVVADLRVGHRHDLTVIARVGQDLLVAGHARVEDDLAVDFAPGAEGPAREHRAVFERQFRGVHHPYRGRSAATPEPGCLISRHNLNRPGAHASSHLRGVITSGNTKGQASVIPRYFRTSLA